MSEAIFFICLTVMIVLFCGEPDLVDALIANLQGCP